MRGGGDVRRVELRRQRERGVRALHDGQQRSSRQRAAAGQLGAEAQAQALVEDSGEVEEVGLGPLHALQAVAKRGAPLRVPVGGGRGRVDGGRGEVDALDGAASPCSSKSRVKSREAAFGIIPSCSSSSSSSSSSSISKRRRTRKINMIMTLENHRHDI